MLSPHYILDEIVENNKFALLWSEAQLCLPYVSLKKRKQKKEIGDLTVSTVTLSYHRTHKVGGN